MKRIELHSKLIHQIVKELGVSRQTVNNALNYRHKNFTARAIRERAKELLIKEAEKITEELIKNQ
jgi:DNA-binding LacI/PurR family transcriptional regulator